MEPTTISRTNTLEVMRWPTGPFEDIETSLRDNADTIIAWVEHHGGTAKFHRDGYGGVRIADAGFLNYENRVVVWNGERFRVMTEDDFTAKYGTPDDIVKRRDSAVPGRPLVFPRDAQTIIDWANGNYDVNIPDLRRELGAWADYFEGKD